VQESSAHNNKNPALIKG